MKRLLDLLGAFGLNALPPLWTTVTIGDLLADDRGISVGVMYPGVHDPGGIPLVRAGDLANNRINQRPSFQISHKKHVEYRRTVLEGGELLLSLVGEIGQCAVVRKGMAGWNVARAIAVLRFKDPSVARYIRIALLSRPLQSIIRAWATTTVQATLNLKEIKQLPLPWPPVNERELMVEVIDAIESKIELHQFMNDTLEAIARTIFDSWFRDGLADLEMGFVSTEWKIATLGDLCHRISMGPFGSDIKTDNFVDSGVPVIRGVNLKAGFIDDGFVYITEGKADALRAANAFADDIVVT
ncbi:MAG TPA: restriction endonuclease subunit S [Candidatus Angelobacter sp.]|jgi:type I restriction enzyme S subunit|nr:restriction endonuclease subunit S [Candidatus Angelobacter sp.]